MKLSVIIVSYKVKYHLEQCLDSVFRALSGIDGDVYVVDNNSQDGSTEYLRRRFPQVHYIDNPDNSGFAKANNIALRLTNAEYVLLLNPDTFISEDTLHRCIKLMDSDKSIGGCGVRMLNQDGTFAWESRRGVPTPLTAFLHMSGLSRLFPRNKTIGRYHMTFLDEHKEAEIEILSGAFMFIRRSLLDKAGLLDETFFMYGEDIDLSYRLLQTGAKNYYLPTRILHYKGESTHKNTFHYVKTFYNAMYIFFRKHYGHYSWILSFPIKAAIFAKGTIEYIRRQLKRILTKPLPDSVSLPRLHFVLSVSEDNKARVSQLCEHNSLQYSFLDERLHTDSRPAASTAMIDSADFIVFDTSYYRYEEILAIIDNLPHGKHRPSIATYSPATGLIIAGSSIIADK